MFSVIQYEEMESGFKSKPQTLGSFFFFFFNAAIFILFLFYFILF